MPEVVVMIFFTFQHKEFALHAMHSASCECSCILLIYYSFRKCARTFRCWQYRRWRIPSQNHHLQECTSELFNGQQLQCFEIGNEWKMFRVYHKRDIKKRVASIRLHRFQRLIGKQGLNLKILWYRIFNWLWIYMSFT